jgi:hypothetical protein
VTALVNLTSVDGGAMAYFQDEIPVAGDVLMLGKGGVLEAGEYLVVRRRFSLPEGERQLIDIEVVRLTKDSLVGRTIAKVEQVAIEGGFGDLPATRLIFTDGTDHTFVHPEDES